MTTAQGQQSRATGWAAPKDRYTAPVLFNPYTGQPRDARDIQSDPQGALIAPPGAAWQAARALPAGDPTSKLSDEPFVTLVRKNAWHKDAWECGPAGNSEYGSQWADERMPVFTAAQVLAMGRVPACPLPCGWDGLHKIAVADGAYLSRVEWPEDEEGVSVQRATVMRNIGNLIEVCRAMLAAPRPPAAQEEK